MTNDVIIQAEVHDPEEMLSGAAGINRSEASAAALFSAGEEESFRQRWSAIQGSFVDSPRAAVQNAEELVGDTVQRLSVIFASERARLEADWSQGNDVSTEGLRLALRRYRSFFDRLLSV